MDKDEVERKMALPQGWKTAEVNLPDCVSVEAIICSDCYDRLLKVKSKYDFVSIIRAYAKIVGK